MDASLWWWWINSIWHKSWISIKSVQRYENFVFRKCNTVDKNLYANNKLSNNVAIYLYVYETWCEFVPDISTGNKQAPTQSNWDVVPTWVVANAFYKPSSKKRMQQVTPE